MRLFNFGIAALTILFAPIVLAQAPEHVELLFKKQTPQQRGALDSEFQDRLSALRDIGVKRARVVEINANALLKRKIVKVNLFDDTTLTLHRTSLEHYPRHGYYEWKGVAESDSYRIDDIKDIRPTDGNGLVFTKEQILEASTINLMIEEYYRNDETGSVSQGRPPSSGFSSSRQGPGQSESSAKERMFYVVTGTILYPETFNAYRLRPIPNDRRKITISELDARKHISEEPDWNQGRPRIYAPKPVRPKQKENGLDAQLGGAKR